MKRRTIALSGAAAALLSVTATVIANAQSPSPVRVVTTVHAFQPKIPSGTPTAGNCWTTSIATSRAGAYRCMAGNAISDPCFATSKPNIVVCEADPTKNKPGFAMSVKGPLPPAPATSSPPTPWLIQLTDGTTCSPLTGTRPFIGKLVVGYACSPAKAQATGTYVGLADTLDTKRAQWWARRVVYRAGSKGAELVSSARVPIAAAWR